MKSLVQNFYPQSQVRSQDPSHEPAPMARVQDSDQARYVAIAPATNGVERSSPIVREIERLTRHHIQLINDRDWDGIARNGRAEHMGADWRGELAIPMRPMTYTQTATFIRSIVTVLPYFHAEVLSMLTEVDEAAGTAEVYLEVEVTGFILGLKSRMMAVHSWKRRKGHWVHTQHKGMAGP